MEQKHIVKQKQHYFKIKNIDKEQNSKKTQKKEKIFQFLHFLTNACRKHQNNLAAGPSKPALQPGRTTSADRLEGMFISFWKKRSILQKIV